MMSTILTIYKIRLAWLFVCLLVGIVISLSGWFMFRVENLMRIAFQGGGSFDSRRPSEAHPNKESSPELEPDTESEEEEDEEKKAAKAAKRLAKEVKFLKTKLARLKDKNEAAKKERLNLKEAMKKNQVLLK